jgi:hypothetical protein
VEFAWAKILTRARLRKEAEEEGGGEERAVVVLDEVEGEHREAEVEEDGAPAGGVVRVDGGTCAEELGETLLLPFGRASKRRAERLRLSCVGWHACLE